MDRLRATVRSVKKKTKTNVDKKYSQLTRGFPPPSRSENVPLTDPTSNLIDFGQGSYYCDYQCPTGYVNFCANLILLASGFCFSAYFVDATIRTASLWWSRQKRVDKSFYSNPLNYTVLLSTNILSYGNRFLTQITCAARDGFAVSPQSPDRPKTHESLSSHDEHKTTQRNRSCASFRFISISIKRDVYIDFFRNALTKILHKKSYRLR